MTEDARSIDSIEDDDSIENDDCVILASKYDNDNIYEKNNIRV